MIEVQQTVEFQKWLKGLRDLRAIKKINQKMIFLEGGHFGDAKYFDGIGELRINYGPGYRLYFVRRGNVFVVLLCGGDKSSQRADITRAQLLAKEC